MVCVAQELRVECIVHDCSKTVGKEKLEVTFPASTSVQELIAHVAQKMNYEPQSFQLTMQTRDAGTRIFTDKTPGSLESAGLCTDPGARNALFLEGIGGNSKNLVKVVNYFKPHQASNSEDNNATSPSSLDQTPSYTLPSLRPPTASPASEYTFSTPLIRHETGYVGLVNQAMTCYLNSLLQALFMTPEFRNALYKWQFDASHISSPSKCIPFQLQKLFLNLQTSSKTAVETTELTRSFGWESGEVWQQHDIQELCRVMFDALEQEFKDTEQADLINQLYQGKMIDYVKCLDCSTEKSREDTFLDIPLPVRPFGSTVAYGSIEEALRAFVQPETLDGNNQYYCDVCEKKCDAHKGLKFTKFPYLLTLHLKRFDFDYSTMHRIKLNDKLVFPEILDLNNFVKSNSSSSETDSDVQETCTKCDDLSTADSALDEDTSHNAGDSQNNDIEQEEDEGIDLTSNSGNNLENEKNRQQYLNSGPFVYELYSIMIHSGSASGGHYYAYIKDFAKGEWYCFNDQSVTSITHEDIKKTYGGISGSARGYYSGAYSSSTNAYMLMYRQINKDLNCSAMVEEEFPPHIKKLLEEIKEIEEREKAIKAKQEEMVRIKVHTAHPLISPSRINKLYCHNELTLADVKSMAYSHLELEAIAPEDQCRLVTYNKAQDEMEESLDGREKETISEVFSSPRYSYDLFMEIREKDKMFLPYNIGDINLTVYLCNVEKEEIESVHQIRTSPCQNLSDLKKLLCMYIPLKSANMHLVLIKPNSLEYLSGTDLPLNKLGFSACNRVFICPQEVEIEVDITETFKHSDLYKFLEEVKNVITLHLVFPDNRKETFEMLLIPPLAEENLVNGEEKPSDSTPTGEELPLPNGIEEEAGYNSGAGGTSDQSTSEDSSLTDSERTIIGEVVNECPLSSPSDSDQQLSSCDSHTPGKINQVNGEVEESWDIESDQSNKNFYFKASVYHAEDGQKMLRVVVDKNIDISQLKKKLEKYFGVASRFMKLMKGTEAQEITCSLRWCKDDERITVKLERVLSEGEQRICVNLLVLTAPNPVQYICDWIVKNGTPISTLKKDLLREVEKRAGLKIPFERCRLREQDWKNPGEVLRDSEVWDEDTIINSRQRIEVYLQELEGPEPVTKQHQVLLFTRRWYPSTLSFGPFEEIVVESFTGSCICKKLSEISGIPIENLKFVKGKAPFPCEMSISSMSHIFWESDNERRYEKEDGAVIFYRDSREELKSLSKEELDATSKETSNPSNSSSYKSGYSPRKERALKIYLDTTPRRARSVVDVD